MKVKQYVLKENVSITFTPDEIWELILICEGDKVFNQDNMRKHTKGTVPYEDYCAMAKSAERMQNKIIEVRKQYGVIEEVEV